MIRPQNVQPRPNIAACQLQAAQHKRCIELRAGSSILIAGTLLSALSILFLIEVYFIYIRGSAYSHIQHIFAE